MKSGADVNMVCRMGRTGLMLAVAGTQNPLVILLLRHPDIDVNLKDNSGQTALFSALSLFKKLFNLGALECFQLLISDPRVEKNVQDNAGDTPLAIAVRLKATKCVQLLLLLGRPKHPKQFW